MITAGGLVFTSAAWISSCARSILKTGKETLEIPAAVLAVSDSDDLHRQRQTICNHRSRRPWQLGNQAKATTFGLQFGREGEDSRILVRGSTGSCLRSTYLHRNAV